MDVQATMKMNNMVKNLTKHGIISNSEEAIQMASKMYNVEQSSKNSGKIEANSNENSEITEVGKLKEELKQLIDKRLQYFIDKNNAAILKEFQELWTKVNQITPEVDNKIAQMRSQMTVSQIQPQQNTSQQTTIPSNPEPKKEDNPRSGSFKEGDVSIEKMFYYGQR